MRLRRIGRILGDIVRFKNTVGWKESWVRQTGTARAVLGTATARTAFGGALRCYQRKAQYGRGYEECAEADHGHVTRSEEGDRRNSQQRSERRKLR